MRAEVNTASETSAPADYGKVLTAGAGKIVLYRIQLSMKIEHDTAAVTFVSERARLCISNVCCLQIDHAKIWDIDADIRRNCSSSVSFAT